MRDDAVAGVEPQQIESPGRGRPSGSAPVRDDVEAKARTGAGGERGAAPGRHGLPGALVWLLPLPLLLLLALPVVALVWRGIADGDGFTPEGDAILRQALGLSLATSAVSTGAIVLFGTPLAFALARKRFPGARAVDLLIDLPIVLPPSVAGIALLLAFGRFGLVGSWLNAAGITIGFTTAAVVLAQSFVAAPFYVRAAAGAFRRIDRDLEIAAANLGASPWRTLRSVTLPLALPSLLAGAVLAWARALGEFGATIMFAGSFPGVTRTMPLAIYGQYSGGDLDVALILSLVLLGLSVVVLLVARWLGGRKETWWSG